MSRGRGAAVLALVLGATAALAAEQAKAPRKDGAVTPLRVYDAKAGGCAPLALISPGAGGSENGYAYLAEGLQAQGWRAIVMGHAESGRSALISLIFHHGVHEALVKLTSDPAAQGARIQDIDAALAWAARSCRAPFTALLGHSMGAATVMIEAGAQTKQGTKGLDRFGAYVALSPQGPGAVFAEHAWRDIKKPLLMMTGTQDKALEAGWESRKTAFDDVPPGCKWLVVIDGATHMNFSGHGASSDVERIVLAESKAFLDGAQTGKCGAPPPMAGATVSHK